MLAVRWLDMGIDCFTFMLPKRYLERPLLYDVLGRGRVSGQTRRGLASAMHHAIIAAAGTSTLSHMD